MAKLSILAGATSQSVDIFIQDATSTAGSGLSGLVFNSSGLTAYYSFAGANAGSNQIVLATLSSITSAYSSGGFKEIDSTNMTGWYRFDIPNAAIATGKGRSVGIHLQGATKMAPCPLEIELTGWDNQDSVRGGMTSLPNATVGSASGLLTYGQSTGQLNVNGGRGDSNVLNWVNEIIPSPTTSGVPEVWVKGYDSGQDPGTYLTNQGYTTTRAIKLDVLVTLEASGIVNDATPGSGSFLGSSNLSASGAYFNNSYLAFTGGQNQALSRRILSYTGGTHGFTFYNPFPLTPSSGDPFVILGGSI